MRSIPPRPVLDDPLLNTPESNAVVDLLVTMQVAVLPLFECEPSLFSRMRAEALALAGEDDGQEVSGEHPTSAYIRACDPTWTDRPGAIHQYSLYNSRHDVTFNDEDHHWKGVTRDFNPRLPALREFVSRYFGGAMFQNFRMQSIRGGSDLGQHRERIVAIPGRPAQFKMRFHLPIVTNPGVKFLMDGQPFTMTAGWVYLFNQGCMHGVSNDGADLRIHYIFDCYLDDDLVGGIIAPACRAAGRGSSAEH